MPENNTYIYKSEVIENYIDRPTIGRFFPFQNHCLAKFAASYYKKTVNAENDFQPTNLAEPDDCDGRGMMQFPKSIKLQTSGALLSRRSRNVVLRYHEPNSNIHPEKYSHSLLILFYSFTNENGLMLDRSYAAKSSEENVLEIINQNKLTFEPKYGLIDSYVHQLHQQKDICFQMTTLQIT